MSLDDFRVSSLTENLEEVIISNEVETRELGSLFLLLQQQEAQSPAAHS
jgi:hypothetical protein